MNVVSSQTQYAVLPSQPIACPPVSRGPEKYKNTLQVFGIIELILGVITCFFGVLSVAFARSAWYYDHGFSYVAQGIWCSAFLIVTGILGVRTKSSPTQCMYNANMTMCIITAIAMSFLVGLSTLAALLVIGYLVVFHIVTAITGFIGFVVVVVHAGYCCAGVCCVLDEQYHRPAVPVRLPNGQIVLCPPQHVQVNTPYAVAQPTQQMGYQYPNVQQPQTSSTPFVQQNLVSQPQAAHPSTSAQTNRDDPPAYSDFPAQSYYK